MSATLSSNSYGLALGRVTGVRHHLESPVVRILWPQARAHLSLQLMPWACFEASPLIAAAFLSPVQLLDRCHSLPHILERSAASLGTTSVTTRTLALVWRQAQGRYEMPRDALGRDSDDYPIVS